MLLTSIAASRHARWGNPLGFAVLTSRDRPQTAQEPKRGPTRICFWKKRTPAPAHPNATTSPTDATLRSDMGTSGTRDLCEPASAQAQNALQGGGGGPHTREHQHFTALNWHEHTHTATAPISWQGRRTQHTDVVPRWRAPTDARRSVVSTGHGGSAADARIDVPAMTCEGTRQAPAGPHNPHASDDTPPGS